MLSALASFIPGVGPVLAIAHSFKTILIVGGVVVVLYFGWSYMATREKVLQLTQENSVLTGNIVVLQQQKQVLADAFAAAEKRVVEDAVEHTLTNKIVEEAKNAPASDDGPIAPVLSRALVGVGQLLSPTNSGPGAHNGSTGP